MGVPALAVAAWGLAGGYSFKYLPFLLVPYAVPFALTPLVAAILTQWPGRRRSITVPAGLILAVLSLVLSGIAVLALVFIIPLSMLDDSGHASDNFTSILAAAILVLVYAAGSVAFVITLTSGARAGSGGQAPRTFLRTFGFVAACATVIIGTAATVGALNVARLDAHGIPVGPVGKAWVAGRPEASMIYPGADGVAKGEAGEERQLKLSSPASAGAVFFTRDAVEQIPAWYADQLGKAGWRPVSLLGTAMEERNWAFKRGERELFELFLYRASGYQAFPDQVQHPGERRFQSIYLVFAPGEPHV